MLLVVFNCGSSSLKFELLELGADSARTSPPWRGEVQGIGGEGRYEFVAPGAKQTGAMPAARHDSAAALALNWLEEMRPELKRELAATVHRIVHGGPTLEAPAIVDPEVLAAIEQASIFAPLHNAGALATIRALGAQLPGIPAVVIADTFFHRTLPEVARSYALPRAVAARYGIRRYGFHGLGHAWMVERYAALVGRPAAALDLITLHLGNGCSAAAIRGGRSVDTSMGLTPLEGLVMGSRCGDLDPAIPGFLARYAGLTEPQIDHLLNNESGLLGLSGVSADLRAVESAAAAGDQAARLAIELFCYRARKYIGAYLAVLGRADGILFGGGIGEHSAAVREQICAGLAGLGVRLERARNRSVNGTEACISAADSPIAVWVVPLDEELYMARAAANLLAPA